MTCKTLMDFTVQLLEDRWCVLKWQPFNVHACPGAGVCIRAADEQEDLMPCDPDLAERWCASSVRHSCGGCGVLPCAQTQFQCSFACASMLPLAKQQRDKLWLQGTWWRRFSVAPAPSLSRRHLPTWISHHSNKVSPHFPSFPFPSPISLPWPPLLFSPQSVNSCHAGLIPVTILSHTTHTPAICMLRTGRAQLGSELKAC